MNLKGKLMIGNLEYFNIILKSAEDPDYQSSIPAAARIALKPALGVLRMLLGIKKKDLEEKKPISKRDVSIW